MSHWTIDNFGKNLEETKNYATKPRQSSSFLPTEGETLEVYFQRLVNSVEEQYQISTNAHINGPKGPWYTHRTPSGCFICNQATLSQYMESIIESVLDAIPKSKKLVFKKDLQTATMKLQKPTKE